MAEFRANVKELLEKYGNGEITDLELVTFLQAEIDFVKAHIPLTAGRRSPVRT